MNETLAQKALEQAVRQVQACYEFKKPRLERIAKYWKLYNGDTKKKIRQLFNVPIPVFPGMIDTLNAQHDTPVLIEFQEAEPSDFFNAQKINAAFRMEVLDTNQNSKWDTKLRMARKHAIMSGVGILEYYATSDPEYKSELNVRNLKDFIFQPKGGQDLEAHAFVGVENITKSKSEITKLAESGVYDKKQVAKLFAVSADSKYVPENSTDEKINYERFKPLGLDAASHAFVGDAVYKLVNIITTIDGVRYYLVFDMWTKTWLRFSKWTANKTLYPWRAFHTHEDDENFMSKSYADDIYPTAEAILALFNQELTNREKRNFGARAYDKDMFKDVRKLDEAMFRPDALVPADTNNGTRRISEGVYEFKVGELAGTVNLIDWMSGTIGRSTGATDLAMGGVQEVSKKASVTFAEQKSISKRIGWGSKPFQDMMAGLGKLYLFGLKDHMPARMAIRVLGDAGWDWDEITRMDLNTTKDLDILVVASDQKIQESEAKAKRRAEALNLLMQSPNINPLKRDEEILRSIGGYEEDEIAEFLDVKTYADKKSVAKAAESIQKILRNEKVNVWHGATAAFVKKIVAYARDKQSTLPLPKFQALIKYAMAHTEIVKKNIDQQVLEDSIAQTENTLDIQAGIAPNGEVPQTATEMANSVPGSLQRSQNIGNAMVE